MKKNKVSHLNLEEGPIKTKTIGKILKIIIDRPKANAIDLKTSRLMGEIFKSFRDDNKLRTKFPYKFKNKIKFLKGIHEDIFFMFMSYFFSKSKIFVFNSS